MFLILDVVSLGLIQNETAIKNKKTKKKQDGMMSCMRNEASDFEKQILKESVVIPSSNPAIQVSYEMAAINSGWGGGGRGLSSLLPRPSTTLQLKLHGRV